MKKTVLSVFLLSMASLFYTHAAHGETVSLVSGGKAAATIVLQDNAPEKMKTAAKDLQHYIRKISGVELPLKTDGARADGFGLYIGKCAPTRPDDFPAKDINPEAYTITVRKEGLFFTGNYPTPAAFAVYSFMENNLGIRWFAPGELWELVPKSKQGELSCQVKSQTVIPGTSARIWSGHNWTSDWAKWNIRNKTVQSERIPLRNFQNRLHTIFPTEKYAEQHPEYYPLCNGKRYIPPKGNVYWRPCESNPEVQKIIVDYICEYFDAHPDVDSFSVGMDDVTHLCGCPNCRAMDAHPTDYAQQAFSTRHYKFVNIIAREVAKRHPDRFIGTLIYQIALNLPEGVDKLEPNVFGYITETCAYWWNEGQMKYDHDLTAEWARRCAHLCRYDYYGFASMTPRYTPHFVDEQMKFDKKLGLTGMYIEVYTFLPLTAPMIWLTAKLQWDASLNTDTLLDNFMDIYGSAKPVMARFWNHLESSYMDPRSSLGRGKWEHRHIKNQAMAISPEQLTQALAMLDEADAATDDPQVHARIDIHRGALLLSRYAVLPYWMCQEANAIVVKTQEDADRILKLAQQIETITSSRDGYLASLTRRNDLLGANYRALTITDPYMPVGNFASLDADISTATLRAIAWYAINRQDELPRKLEQLGAEGSALRIAANAYISATAPGHTHHNAMFNGDFENLGKDTARAETEMDWSKDGAPNGWSWWTNTPGVVCGLSTNARSGQHALCVKGSRGNACTLQRVNARPGERYMLIGWLKASGGGNAAITIRFNTPDGKWHPDRSSEIEWTRGSQALKDWFPVSLLFTMPPKSGKAVIMLGAKNQHSTADAVFFDDFSLIRVE